MKNNLPQTLILSFFVNSLYKYSTANFRGQKRFGQLLNSPCTVHSPVKYSVITQRYTKFTEGREKTELVKN